jgi:hypothetical protein
MLEYIDACGRHILLDWEKFDSFGVARLVARQLEKKFGKDWRIKSYVVWNNYHDGRTLYIVQFRSSEDGEYATLWNDGQLR